MTLDPQIVASDPDVSAFVTANAGSGKTRTLVDRVARLLLRGARPEAILCVTYTKAAAAEMQRRLFETLGEWAVMADDPLAERLAGIEERPASLSVARALFARALETPGGLKIQTIHGFCEKLLRRFPLEAGVPPGFRVLEDQAARETSARARDDVARAALDQPEGPIGRAYAHFAVALDYRSFQEMFAAFEARRIEIRTYVDACSEDAGVQADVWRRCGFDAPEDAGAIRLAAVSPPTLDPDLWAMGARALAARGARDAAFALDMAAVAEQARQSEADFEQALGVFCTAEGEPAKWVQTAVAFKADPVLRERLLAERERLFMARDRARAAQVAYDTIAALTLARVYGALYEAAKQAQGALDFADLIARTQELLTIRADAAWVLFKMDGGVDHMLVDEAQDTAPAQWDILRPLAEEFFAGAGAQHGARTMFAVGDEKQSIYSFQGAVLDCFAEETAGYRRLVEGAGRPFSLPRLTRSWRSTPEVLAFVDTVFTDPAAAAALRPESARADERPVHHAIRLAGAGSVDLWPLEEADAVLETDAWAPVDAEPAESANRKLARRMAREIKAMVDRGEGVFDKDSRAPRPMDFGDVLILVRRRGALFQEIIRALKREGVPVGGADRLSLSEHVVFHDLTGLARICLYPWDDLTLAALLRSPLCDVGEDGLYDLARGRSGFLWGALGARAGERPEWRAARDLLAWARLESRRRPPFDFYARLLGYLDGRGRSVRARILTRLGREAEQALDAFLGEALAAERRGVRDLETFAADMAASAVEVKREQDEGKGEVRVMTVHGAKGLEAPVVILPDTSTRASVQGGPLLAADDGGFLWSARKADDCTASARAREARTEAGDRESLRLLYVALTRARDRLIICGVTPGRPNLMERSWWDFVNRARNGPAIVGEAREIVDAEGRTAVRIGPDPAPVQGGPPTRAAAARAPDWTARAAAPEAPLWRYASPSQMAEAGKAPAPSPLAAVAGLGRYRRGDLIHKLLQVLPDLEPARRPAAALSLLERERDLTPDQRAEMIAAAQAVLDDPRFAAVFGPASRAEVALAGGAPDLPRGLAVSGRIDRLVVEPDRVLVVDYKTNRPSPERIEAADPAYVTQMAVYAAVLRAAFPGRRVEAALVWTDGPKLMTVPEKLMAEALQALPTSG